MFGDKLHHNIDKGFVNSLNLVYYQPRTRIMQDEILVINDEEEQYQVIAVVKAVLTMMMNIRGLHH